MVLSLSYLGSPHTELASETLEQWFLPSQSGCKLWNRPVWVKKRKHVRRKSGDYPDREEFLSFGRKISSLPVTGKQLILSSGEKWPFTKIEGRENKRDPGRMHTCNTLWVFWGMLFLKLVLSSCYFCETPLLLYTKQCIMDSRAGNWCAVGMQCAREIIGILFHGRKSIMKPIKMSQF